MTIIYKKKYTYQVDASGRNRRISLYVVSEDGKKLGSFLKLKNMRKNFPSAVREV